MTIWWFRYIDTTSFCCLSFNSEKEEEGLEVEKEIQIDEKGNEVKPESGSQKVENAEDNDEDENDDKDEDENEDGDGDEDEDEDAEDEDKDKDNEDENENDDKDEDEDENENEDEGENEDGDDEYDGYDFEDYYNKLFDNDGEATTEVGNFCSNHLPKCWVDFPTQLLLILKFIIWHETWRHHSNLSCEYHTCAIITHSLYFFTHFYGNNLLI